MQAIFLPWSFSLHRLLYFPLGSTALASNMAHSLSSLIVNKYNLNVVLFVALGVLSTAYGLAVIGSTVGQPNFYTYFNLATAGTPGYTHTTNIIGALNGVNSAGAIIGCLTSAWTADKYSRKRTLQGGCVILIIGGALCAGSINIAMFLVGRVIAGIGAGVLACVVPIYQSEVSTPETRGAMVSITGIMYAFGYSLAGWLGFACFFIPADSSLASFAWRFPLAFQCLAPLVVLAGSGYIPFSPRWLLSQGRREEALEVVKKLHYTPQDTEHVKAREEFYLIEKQYELDSQLTQRRLEIFRTPANRKRALIAFLLMWGDQFLGTLSKVKKPRKFPTLIIFRYFRHDKLRSPYIRKPRPHRLRSSSAQRNLDYFYHTWKYCYIFNSRSLRPTYFHADRLHRLRHLSHFPMCVDG
jgi:MFS family permease